ncbi:hypothetical protein [Thermogemmata fonticola]|jgi:hypothetical protein|uniref:Uncharacterized protein n=1 Tax=Thermogemmata fonticola TaxID=2755323 RepID=A0A7V8VEV2_9BACT|nr:hypothetical protein [Thermogemmata fonticola]MBA2226666.1 hypothetical protein [Thermogemmata fonticola]
MRAVIEVESHLCHHAEAVNVEATEEPRATPPRQVPQSVLWQWSGRKLRPLQPVAKTIGEKTVSEMIIEDRR